jgi:DNA-binding NtrC family response regulator
MSNLLKKHRIFVVDDEEVIASTLALILQKSGFEAVPFTQPLKVLESSRTDLPDLLISDVMMPVLNGIDLAIQIQEICPSCKVLPLSGQANTQRLLDSARLTGNHFECVAKPVHPTEILRKIRESLGITQTS